MMPRLVSSLMVVAVLSVSCFADVPEECPGNQERQDCGSCMWTCDDLPLSEQACIEICRIDACGCPQDFPVWHDGWCIKESECPRVDPCERVECDEGYTCKQHEVTCVRAPCPAVALCENLAEMLCAATTCPEGNVCKVDEVQCESYPCDPVPGCVDAEICNLPQVVGPCEALIPSWYYDSQLERCTPFDYGGCEGNENRFISKSACEIACKPYDPCQGVTCEPGYACESRDVQCIQAPCLPVAECVDLAEGCDELSCPNGETCKLTEVQCFTTPCYPQPMCVDEEICDQPEAVRGSCRNWMDRWYYNKRDNNCQKFEYGGCGGNENNFLSKSACEKSCQNTDMPFCPVESPLKDAAGNSVCCGHCLVTVQCPSTHFCHVHPADAFIICCQREDLTACQQAKLRNDDPELMDAPSIDCNEDGSFAKKQCDGFLGVCYCVTPEDGRVIPDSTVSQRDPEELDCDADKFKPYYGEKHCLAEFEKGHIPGGYLPSCDEFGLYEKKQCHTFGPEYGDCWCVTKEGTEVPTSRRNHNMELDCDDVKFWASYNNTPCFDEREEMKEVMDAHMPDCDALGFYQKRQCYYMDNGRDGWICWCATKEGREIPGSTEKAGKDKGLNAIALDCEADKFQAYYDIPYDDGIKCYSCTGSSSEDSSSCFNPDKSSNTPAVNCIGTCHTTTTVNQLGFTTVSRGCGSNHITTCAATASGESPCCDDRHQCNDELVKDLMAGSATRPQTMLAALLGVTSLLLTILSS